MINAKSTLNRGLDAESVVKYFLLAKKRYMKIYCISFLPENSNSLK